MITEELFMRVFLWWRGCGQVLLRPKVKVLVVFWTICSKISLVSQGTLQTFCHCFLFFFFCSSQPTKSSSQTHLSACLVRVSIAAWSFTLTCQESWKCCTPCKKSGATIYTEPTQGVAWEQWNHGWKWILDRQNQVTLLYTGKHIISFSAALVDALYPLKAQCTLSKA